MNQIILHHYPQSPVSEKVRVGFGVKGLSWASVEVPRIPPKPDLMPLTGGYRRAPVMQIGADVYCDSQCILRALQQRFPKPTFYPGGGDGMVWGISRWIDTELFSLAVKLVLGSAAHNLPADFAADRGRLYLGPDHDLAKVGADLPHILGQIRAHLGWMEQRLATGRTFMLGDQPGLPDVLAYYIVWFIRGRWTGGPAFLNQFPSLEAWESRVAAIGHGTMSEMSAVEALEIASGSETVTPDYCDKLDPQEMRPGTMVSVVPDIDGGDPEVTGPLRYLDAETVAILHEHAHVGTVCIHFPRAGYRVTPA